MVRDIVPNILKKPCSFPNMENKEKEFIKLRFGLTFKKIIDRNKAKALENKDHAIVDRNLINSFRKLEIASGIRNATILEIIAGKKNAASTTIIALLDALEMTLSEFGSLYDSIKEQEISDYKRTLEKNKKEKGSKEQEQKKNITGKYKSKK